MLYFDNSFWKVKLKIWILSKINNILDLCFCNAGLLVIIHYKVKHCKMRILKKKQKNFMAPFHGWGSTASRLQPLRGGSLLILSTSEGWKAESTLEPVSGLGDPYRSSSKNLNNYLAKIKADERLRLTVSLC